MVKTPVSDPDKAPVLSTSASSSATKRSRKKKGVSDERQPWLKEHYPTPLLRARSDVDGLYATNAKVARQRRRTIRARMRNKGPQQTIQHSQSTTLSEQSHTINDADSERVNKRTARALRMEKLIKKRVATPKQLNMAASGNRPGGRYRRPVVNKWDLVTCPNCKAIVWNAEAVVHETQNSPRRFSICCQQGRVNLPPRRQPPSPLKELLEKSSFNLEPLVRKPAQAKRYRSLMDSCLEANNVHAHFVTGMLQYFDSPNQFLGMHHLRIASKAGHLQGRYVYGVLLMAIGQTEKGVRIINKLTDEKGIETVKNCIQDFTLSLYRLDRNVKDIYVTSLTTMKPDHQCQPPDVNTACSKCYHFFLMTEFFETMIGLN